MLRSYYIIPNCLLERVYQLILMGMADLLGSFWGCGVAWLVICICCVVGKLLQSRDCDIHFFFGAERVIRPDMHVC